MPSSRSRSSRASSSAAPPTADEPSEPKPPTAEPETAEAARTRSTIRKPSKASARKRLDQALPVAVADVDAPGDVSFAFPALLSPRSRAGVELSRASAARRAAAVAADAARRAHDARRVPAVRVARAAPPPPPPPVSGPPPPPPPEARSGEAGDLRVRRVGFLLEVFSDHRGTLGELVLRRLELRIHML